MALRTNGPVDTEQTELMMKTIIYISETNQMLLGYQNYRLQAQAGEQIF